MKKFWIQFTTLVVVILAGTYLTFHPNLFSGYLFNTPTTVSPNVKKQLKVGETLVSVELADTASLRQQGLSGRTSLDPNSGMLFIFTELKKYRFWMKGMLIPLDFIFIKDGVVVDIIKNVPPPSPGTTDANLPNYEPSSEVNMMLEVNANFTDSHSIKVGDKISLVE